MPRGTTPLLILLDELLPRDANDVDQQQHQRTAINKALQDMNEMLVNVGGRSLPRHTFPLETQDVVNILDIFLRTFPSAAYAPSTYDGSIPLHFAAALGNVPIASTILKFYPPGAATPNTKGKLPVHYAAREGRVNLVSFFMQVAPYTAAIASKKDKLPLHFAAAEGHLEIMEALLRAYPRGASLPSAKGKIPLHFAARWGHIRLAKSLLKAFPDGCRALDWDGSLPLHDAAREGQLSMSKFLIGQFPLALATANLRGDIPLFSAARASSFDLFLYLLRAWPEGAVHILQGLTQDDCASEWLTREVLELLLRGTVDMVESSVFVHKYEPPMLRLVSELNPVSTGEPSEDELEEGSVSDEKKSTYDADFFKSFETVPNGTLSHTASILMPDEHKCDTIEHRAARLLKHRTDSGTHDHSNLHGGEEENRPPIKRLKPCHDCPVCGDGCTKVEDGVCSQNGPCDHCRNLPQTAFLPLHAALMSDASIAVIHRILDDPKLLGKSLEQEDEKGRLPLHHGIKWAKQKPERTRLLIDRIFTPHPAAASQRDPQTEQYPLLMAIENISSAELVSALIQSYPAAAIDAQPSSERPLELACKKDLELGVVYELLRVDPGFLETKLEANGASR